MNALVLPVDETPIIINGKQYYLHNISDGKHTLQYVTEHRSKNDVDEFGFLNNCKGIIVHDHYKMYYNYGADNVHILRYLNAVTEFTNYTWAKQLKNLLFSMKEIKDDYIAKRKKMISDTQYNEFKKQYLEILSKGTEERKKTYLLMLIKKFFIPFSNNRAEADLRGVRIKQKTGKFRSVEGANIYAVIKSNINLYQAVTSILNGNPILI